MGHLTDEELLLEFYEESTPAERARVRSHLAHCEQCRALDDELRAVLNAVEATPVMEPPSGFERQMWARIEPLLPVPKRTSWHAWTPHLALAAGIVLLVAAAFTAGLSWERPAVNVAEVSDENALIERLLRTEVEDHLERSQRVLVELVNADVDTGDQFRGDRARAADLVAAGRLYRRSAESMGDREIGVLLEDLERVLVEVANGSPETSARDLARLRQRIGDQDLLFRLRVVSQEIRERERQWFQ